MVFGKTWRPEIPGVPTTVGAKLFSPKSTDDLSCCRAKPLLKKLGGRAFAPRNGRFLSTERGEEHPWVFLLPNKVARCCRAGITCRKKMLTYECIFWLGTPTLHSILRMTKQNLFGGYLWFNFFTSRSTMVNQMI